MTDNVTADPEFARQFEAIRKQAKADATLIDRMHTAEVRCAILESQLESKAAAIAEYTTRTERTIAAQQEEIARLRSRLHEAEQERDQLRKAIVAWKEEEKSWLETDAENVALRQFKASVPWASLWHVYAYVWSNQYPMLHESDRRQWELIFGWLNSESPSVADANHPQEENK